MWSALRLATCSRGLVGRIRLGVELLAKNRVASDFVFVAAWQLGTLPARTESGLAEVRGVAGRP